MRKIHSAIILVGLPGSGKSTYYKNNYGNTHLPISLDMLKTRSRELKIFSACLAGKANFVIDNTNCSRKERSRYLDLLLDPRNKPNWLIDCYYFNEDVDECLERNRKRLDKKIPDVVIYSARKRLEVPSYEEGFDSIYSVNSNGSKKLWKSAVKV